MPRFRQPSPYHVALGVMLRMALTIGAVEGAVLLLRQTLEWHLPGALAPLLDTLLLVLLSTPLLYFWVVRPLVVERERQLAASEYLAHHDELTQLCNRRMFYDHLEHCLPGLARRQRVAGLIYLDLDGFKPINDEYGHEMGDRVLAQLGQRLSDAVRGEDVVARLGGDEFALLLSPSGEEPATARRQAQEIAERVLELIAQPMRFEGVLVQVGCSVGVHLLSAADGQVRAAMKQADRAMYRAKQHSGSIVFSDTLGKRSYEIQRIGVAEIDQEHHEIDQLLDELMQREQPHPAALRGFIALVETHFHHEVQISSRLGLSMTPDHLHAHHQLLEELRQIGERSLQADWNGQLRAIGTALEAHVTVYDRALRELPPRAESPLARPA